MTRGVRREQTQYRDGPWPFLYSYVAGRGLVRNVGMSRKRARTPQHEAIARLGSKDT
jgi:hypothetical protein